MQTVAEKVTNNYSSAVCGILRLRKIEYHHSKVPFFRFSFLVISVYIVVVVMVFNKGR